METHLDAAINYYKKIAQYDLSIFKTIVASYLIERNIKSKIDLKPFYFISTLNPHTTIYYQIKDNEIHILSEHVEGAKKITDSHSNRLKSKAQKITGKITASSINIARALLAIEEIQKSGEYKGINNIAADETVFADIIYNKVQSNEDIRTELIKQAMLFFKESIKFTKFIDQINMELFGYLGKSILNAEYLILNDYKKQLEKIDVFFDGSGAEVDRGGDLYTLKSFLKICWHLQEFCLYIRRYLVINSPFNLVLVNSDREKRYCGKFKREPILYGKDETIILENLLQSIIEMTMIDHCYKSDEKSVQVLFYLYEQLKRPINTSNSLANEVVSATKIKASSLLDRIINDKYHKKTERSIEVNYDYIINCIGGKEKLVNDIQDFCITNANCTDNIFIKKRDDNKNDIFSLEELDTSYILDDNFTDLKLYHEAINIGIEAYHKQSKIIRAIHEYDLSSKDRHKIIQEIITFIGEPHNDLTPSFFRQVLKFVSESIDEIKKKNEKKWEQDSVNTYYNYITLIKKILLELSNYLKRYSTNIPFFYRPHFWYSFYECSFEKDAKFWKPITPDCINNYNCNSFKNKFFFASVLCTPMNNQYLEGLYIIYYQRHENDMFQYEQIYGNFLNDSISGKLTELQSSTDKFKNALDKKVQEGTTKIAGLEGNLEKVVKDEEKKIKKIVKVNIVNVSQELSKKHLEMTTVSLGVFAAFIAFVTISINMVKIAENIRQFICYSATFMGCLLVFAVYMKHSPFNLFQKKNKNEDIVENVVEEEGNFINFISHIGISLLVLILFFFISFAASWGIGTFDDQRYEKHDSIMKDQAAKMRQYEAELDIYKTKVDEQDSMIYILQKQLNKKRPPKPDK